MVVSSSKRRRGGEIEIEIENIDNGGCKQRRIERRQTLTTVKEEVCNKRIRLFKWYESLVNDKYSDTGIGIGIGIGIIMVHVNNNIKVRTQSPDGTIVQVEQGTEKNNIEYASFFELDNGRDYMRSLALLTLEASDAFEEYNTIIALAAEISTYISSNFRFTNQNLSCPRTGRVVIFVEVDMFTTKEYRVINDAEDVMAMDQDCGNVDTDQEENNDRFDQKSYVYVVSEDGSIEPDTKETGEEEEEIQLKVDNMEDVSGVVSSPELMEIQGMLWRCLEDWPDLIRVNPDFSRDSKGLKQVEDAMEIITEFHGNVKKVNSSCPCCLEGFSKGGATAVKTRCSHLFHRHCLCLWLSKKDSCPLCRSPCATFV